MDEKVDTRRCPRCDEDKPLAHYTAKARSGVRVSGMSAYCRACRKEVNLIQYGNRRRGYKLEDAFNIEF